MICWKKNSRGFNEGCAHLLAATKQRAKGRCQEEDTVPSQVTPLLANSSSQTPAPNSKSVTGAPWFHHLSKAQPMSAWASGKCLDINHSRRHCCAFWEASYFVKFIRKTPHGTAWEVTASVPTSCLVTSTQQDGLT